MNATLFLILAQQQLPAGDGVGDVLKAFGIMAVAFIILMAAIGALNSPGPAANPPGYPPPAQPPVFVPVDPTTNEAHPIQPRPQMPPPMLTQTPATTVNYTINIEKVVIILPPTDAPSRFVEQWRRFPGDVG